MKIKDSLQRGQSFVILAVAFIGMLGFAGLAIDGGMLYSDRRNAQNAADAASMAGALALLHGTGPTATASCGGSASNPLVLSAACSRAADNDYVDSDYTSVGSGPTDVLVYHPPIDGPYAGEPLYVQVRIRSQVEGVFAHFVYGGPLENTVTAVARAKPPTVEPFMNGHAVVGLAKSGCAVVWSHGTADVDITGGGIQVNSDHANCAFKASGSNELEVHGDYDINVVGGFEISGSASVSPVPKTGVGQVETPDVTPPTCTTSGTRDSGTGVVTPGNISDFNFNGGTWTLEPGIYCVTGGFTVNAGTQLNGSEVMIYIISGDLTWNGGATINLDAMDDGEYAGMLIYQNPSNTEMATINGDSNSHFFGTMYLPGAEVQINGTGAADGFHSQVIGNTVDMSGTSTLNILYEGGENYKKRDPGQVELTE